MNKKILIVGCGGRNIGKMAAMKIAMEKAGLNENDILIVENKKSEPITIDPFIELPLHLTTETIKYNLFIPKRDIVEYDAPKSKYHN